MSTSPQRVRLRGRLLRGRRGTSPVLLCLRNLRSPVPRSFHILTSFSHESDSHRNSFARLRIQRWWHRSQTPPRLLTPPPTFSHAGRARSRAGRQAGGGLHLEDRLLLLLAVRSLHLVKLHERLELHLQRQRAERETSKETRQAPHGCRRGPRTCASSSVASALSSPSPPPVSPRDAAGAPNGETTGTGAGATTCHTEGSALCQCTWRVSGCVGAIEEAHACSASPPGGASEANTGRGRRTELQLALGLGLA